jgi:hypothetical protein
MNALKVRFERKTSLHIRWRRSNGSRLRGILWHLLLREATS